ncbi:hypothetical protein [Caldalkalibacillus mannanilyticus]|uniref:hypothetical protein n=1 Tax=Caldalkalibacillus mannanilyticus TaxID=1418 RepID=UPI000AB64612|nr:hypothetical protein [Caldalkalibacillus mannanilyticus]
MEDKKELEKKLGELSVELIHILNEPAKNKGRTVPKNVAFQVIRRAAKLPMFYNLTKHL